MRWVCLYSTPIATRNPEHKMNSATFQDRSGNRVTVKVGDTVGFKCDVEQCGTVTKIEPAQYGKFYLTLTSRYGFSGEYIGGQTVTRERSDDVWVD